MRCCLQWLCIQAIGFVLQCVLASAHRSQVWGLQRAGARLVLRVTWPVTAVCPGQTLCKPGCHRKQLLPVSSALVATQGGSEARLQQEMDLPAQQAGMLVHKALHHQKFSILLSTHLAAASYSELQLLLWLCSRKSSAWSPVERPTDRDCSCSRCIEWSAGPRLLCVVSLRLWLGAALVCTGGGV